MKDNMSRTLVLLSCLLIAFTATAGYSDTGVTEKRQTIQVVDQSCDVIAYGIPDMEAPGVVAFIHPDLGVAKTVEVPLFERTLAGYTTTIRPSS